MHFLIFRYAEKVKAMHFTTSAKANEGVEEMFLTLTQKMLDDAKEKAANNHAILSRQGSQRTVTVVDDETVPPSNKSCC